MSNISLSLFSKGNGYLDSFTEDSRSISSGSDGKGTIYYGGEHKGYYLEISFCNGMKEGEGELFSDRGIRIGTFTFHLDEVTGPCSLFNTNGFLTCKGYMRNGILIGAVQEFTEDGGESIVFYRDGTKYSTLHEVENFNGFWKEIKDNKILSISQYNLNWLKHGVCFVFQNDIIHQVVLMVNDTED